MCLPALVHLDLLLDQLSVGTLCFLLSHSDQLDQLRPGQEHRGDVNRNKRVGCYITHSNADLMFTVIDYTSQGR